MAKHKKDEPEYIRDGILIACLPLIILFSPLLFLFWGIGKIAEKYGLNIE